MCFTHRAVQDLDLHMLQKLSLLSLLPAEYIYLVPTLDIAPPWLGANHLVAGVAWASLVGISKIEVQIDDQPWRTAVLGPEIAKTTWRQWWIDWNATKGAHQVTVRAIDSAGNMQSTANVPIDPNGAEGLHTITVQVI